MDPLGWGLSCSAMPAAGVLGLESLERNSDASRSWLLLVLNLWALSRDYDAICSWLPFIQGFEVLGRGTDVNCDLLLLMPLFRSSDGS